MHLRGVRVLGLLLAALLCSPPLAARRRSPRARATAPPTAPPGAEAPLAGPAQGSASEVFQRLRPLVLEVRTAATGGSGKAVYGSAFVVDKSGLLITNYHVVATVLQNRERLYKVLVQERDGGQPIEGQVLGVDLIHDLALVRVPRTFPTAFTFADKDSAQGDRLYSMGIPHDLNLSIIEGVCNDVIRSAPYEQLHVSSPLNSGMSGGPTVNQAGQVVGVNVAVLREASNISFSVPARFAQALLAARRGGLVIGPYSPELHQIVATQMTEVQAELTRQLLQATAQAPFEGWLRGAVPEHIKCWSEKHSDNEERPRYHISSEVCHPSGQILIDHRNMAGSYHLHTRVIEPGALNRLQVYSLLDQMFNEESMEETMMRFAAQRHVNTRNECDARTVVGKGGVPLRVLYCINAYRDYPGLYDYTMRVATLTADRPLLLELSLSGFQAESIRQIVAARLDQIQRQAGPR